MLDTLDLDALWREARASTPAHLLVRPFTTQSVSAHDDARPALSRLAAREPGVHVVLVSDATPKAREGQPLLDEVRAALPASTELVLLPAGVDVSSARADELTARVAGSDLIVAVGSGSVTDLAKRARDHGAPEAVLIAWPTAPSVTAYSSALVVLSVDGVKRTLPSRAPDHVLLDWPTLVSAPPVMLRAGFGDVLARAVSYGDWWLAQACGLDDGFCQAPAAVMGQAEQTMVEHAMAVGRGEFAGVAAVTEGVLRAGLAMSVVAQTAPLSGWEHVISHWLDMTASGWQRQPALHGEQVGVATLVSGRAYERLLPQLDPGTLTADLPHAVDESWRAALGQTLGVLDPTGAMVAEAWRDVSAKLAAWREATVARDTLAQQWPRHGIPPELGALLRPAAEVEAALRAAGAPADFGALSQPVSAAAARQAITHAHLVRRRLTLGDVLMLAGLLDDAAADALVA